MLLRCLPPSFSSIWFTVREQITIENFQDGRHGFWWRCRKCEKLLKDIMMRDWPWSTDHGINWPGAKAPGELTIEDLQDGCCGSHRGYSSKMFLAILNLHCTPCHPNVSIWLTIWEQMKFENFQDGHPGGHLRYQTRTILAILKSLSLWCLPSSLGSIRITVWEEMSFEEFEDGPHSCHLGCWNGTSLAVLNLHVECLPPI